MRMARTCRLGACSEIRTSRKPPLHSFELLYKFVPFSPCFSLFKHTHAVGSPSPHLVRGNSSYTELYFPDHIPALRNT